MDIREKYERGRTWEEWLASIKQNKERYREKFAAYPLTEEDVTFLRSVERDVHILALGEDWCGDVMRQLPIVAKMAAQNEHLKLRILSRDENLDVMERYLFNGAQVIPVFVFFNDRFIEVGHWQGRPAKCRELISRGKAAGKLDEARALITRMMDETNDRMTVEEIKALIAKALVDERNWQEI